MLEARLKRDADALAVVVEGRAAAVAAVDGGVYLHAQQVSVAVHVVCYLDRKIKAPTSTDRKLEHRAGQKEGIERTQSGHRPDTERGRSGHGPSGRTADA